MDKDILVDNSKGQGLIEVIIAIGIIVTGLTADLSLAQSSIKATNLSDKRITAANLSREGLEVAQNIRDSNWLNASSRGFDDGLVGPSDDHTARPSLDTTTGTWTLDYTPSDIDTCSQNGSCRVYQVGNTTYTNYYTVGARATDFHRVLYLNEICTDNSTCTDGICGLLTSCGAEGKIGVQAVSHVRWFERGNEHDISMELRLYDWRDIPVGY